MNGRFGIRSTYLGLTLLIIAIIALTNPIVQGSPAEEITRAISASGAPNVNQADATVFIKAFSSILVRTKQKDVPEFVSAAIKLRRDLAPRIVVAALRSHRRSKNVSYAWVAPIIRAAIAAAPEATAAILRAAIAAEPDARKYILAAAGLSENDTAFPQSSGVDAGNINSNTIGTINPANFVNSPEQPPP